MNERMIR